MRRTFIKFYAILLACLLGMSILFGAIYKNAIDEITENYLGDLLATVMNVIGTELKNIPPNEWKQALKDRKIDTTFNLDIQPSSYFEMDDASVKALARGEIVSVPDDDIYIQKIQGSDYVLIAGPISYAFFLEQIEWVDYALFSAIALFLVIPIYLWMRPHWQDLRLLENAAKQVSQGNLSAQVQLGLASDIQPIAKTFNHMTQSIQSLVDRQDTLIQDIAHEVRTPLTRLRYRLALLEMDSQAQQGMEADIEDINQLIEELLFKARIDASAPNIDHFMGLAWLEQRVDLAKTALQQSIDWQIQCDPDLVCMAEQRLMTRALDNLLNNAKRFTSCTIRVELYRTHDAFYLKVEDDGMGIPQDKQSHVFDPFVRLDNSRTRATGGHGLGLSIVSSIAKAHNGQASVQSSSMGGVCFVITWPLPMIEEYEG